MKKFTISEFAKLRGTTSETLRHYDRIGLLKPDVIDKNNGYRYYSITQYEKLGTIKELRQLGISLDHIKNYFENRNLDKTRDVLIGALEDVENQMNELSEIESALKKKLKFLEMIMKSKEEFTPVIKTVEKRYNIMYDHGLKGEQDMCYGWSMLEKALNGVSPIIATNRIGWVFKNYKAGSKFSDMERTPFIFTYNLLDGGNVFEAGDYVSVYYKGHSYNQKAYDVLIDYINENNLEIDGDPLCFMQVDSTITDENQERSCEIQIKIKSLT
jgi:DNA-binding transcriptional MerR regulator